MKRSLTLLAAMFVAASVFGHTSQDPTPQDHVNMDVIDVPFIATHIAIGMSARHGPVLFLRDAEDEWYEVTGVGGIAEQCIRLAEATCGKGKICSMKVTVTADGDSCEFECRDAHGNCAGSPGPNT